MRIRTRLISMICILLLLLVGSAVMADDGRINPPPYHFGGDTLYCDQGAGCRLLNIHGELLTTWAESDIAAALAAVDETGANALVGDGTGTYGTASLWAVPTNDDSGNKQLCLFAYDEWGKQNDMCFAVTTDGKYLPAPLAVSAEPVPDCSAFMLDDWVALIADHNIDGPIQSIDTTNGTVTFGKHGDFTASCDEVEKVA